MDKQQLRKAIVSLATGQVKRGVLVLLTHDCPPDHYRTGMNGEKLITAAEAEQLASEAEIVITFNRPTNDKLQKSEGPVSYPDRPGTGTTETTTGRGHAAKGTD